MRETRSCRGEAGFGRAADVLFWIRSRGWAGCASRRTRTPGHKAAAQGRQGSTEQRWLCGGGHTAGGGHTLRASASHGAAPDLTALSMESQPFLGCLGRGCQAPLSQTPLLGRQRRESPHPHPRLPRRQRRRGKDACRCQPPRACSDGARQPGAPAAVRLTAHDVVGGGR